MVKELRLLSEVCQADQRPSVVQYIADLKREKHYLKVRCFVTAWLCYAQKFELTLQFRSSTEN